MSRRERIRHRRRGRRRSRLGVVLIVIAVVIALSVVSLGAYVAGIAATAPPLERLRPIDQGASSAVFAADGSRLGYIQSDEIRTPIPLREIPKSLRAATVAIEDQRFYQHGAIDLTGIVRAALRNFESGKTVQGGSTITQQLVRNLYISQARRDLARKIREAKLAGELEKRHPGRRGKDWILGRYLNSVSYGTVGGRSAVGVEAAALTYFSKHARDLTLEEAALLAGLPQAPSQYNPFQNPGAALERRNEVLQKMAKLAYISSQRAERAYTAPLGLKRGSAYTLIREPYFFDFVKQQLIEKYGVNTVRKGGLRIFTTIDPKLQVAGREAIQSVLNQTGDPSSALVAVDPRNGYIRAMVSSATYDKRQFNLAAQGHRQPGSAFKTFVLTTAVREGVNPAATSYVSRPLQIQVPGYGTWKVQTYDHRYGGRMDLVRATLRSDNTVFAQLDLDLTPEAVRQTAYDMGIETELDAVPSEGLGGLRLGVSALEMATAYATLASGGFRNTPIAIKRVRFADGKIDQLGKPKRTKVFSDAVAYEVTRILEQNVTSGTGTRAQIGCPAAGKTGTTDRFNDAWFAGYTPQLSAATWVGYPDALQEMRSVHGISVAGGTFPAMIWQGFMQVAKGTDCSAFPRPTERIEWKPFKGKYSLLGGPVRIPEANGPGERSGGKVAPEEEGSAGGGGHTGYDERLYTPGNEPQTGAPPEPPSGDKKGPKPKSGGGQTGGTGPGLGDPG